MTPTLWIIQLSDETLVRSIDVTVGQMAAVGVLLDTTDHAALDPTKSFQALATWLAVLEAAKSEGDVMVELEKIMQMSVPTLYSKIMMD